MPLLINGTNSPEYLPGTNFDDIINGLDGADTLEGFLGKDTLDGGLGADTMIGGIGDDIYFVDNVGDVVVELAAQGQDTVKSTISYTMAANVENLFLLDAGGAINGTGNGGNDSLYGNSSDNVLTGGGGNDTLYGMGGADTMIGGMGDDYYSVAEAGDIVIENAAEGKDWVYGFISYTLGTNVENLILQGIGNLDGTGNASDNFLQGTSGANVLVGLDGHDKINGLGGADTMVGGLGNDEYWVDQIGDVVTENAGEGTDAVRSTITYVLGANVENLILEGSASINGIGNELDNKINGNSGNNLLKGGGGDDELSGGLGADTMVGGAGDDEYSVDSIADVVTEKADEGIDWVVSKINYTLGANVEHLSLSGSAIEGIGNGLDNCIWGNGLNNLLMGLDGDDYLVGGAGADTMIGGIGSDYYKVDNVNDTVTEAADQGYDEVSSLIDYTLGANFERLFLEEGSATTAVGNELDNHLVGNSNDNVLIGGGGGDLMHGGAGDDSYWIDTYLDSTMESAGNGIDTVYASHSYVLFANVENMTLLDAGGAIDGTGNELDNILYGNSSANVFFGLDGVDQIFAGDGYDHLWGGIGDDLLEGGAGGDVLGGGDGVDTISYASSTSQVLINLGNGLVAGGHAVDDIIQFDVENLIGSAFDDGLFGNGFVNVLTGAVGDDYLWGGFNADTFAFASGFDHDTIGDFAIAEDRIQFDDAVFANFAAVQAAMQQVGADTVITFGPQDSIVIENVAVANLTAGHFLFV
jgi:Ca2+-binding RTX toxin-like protein